MVSLKNKTHIMHFTLVSESNMTSQTNNKKDMLNMLTITYEAIHNDHI